jgi:hypothetical protein
MQLTAHRWRMAVSVLCIRELEKRYNAIADAEGVSQRAQVAALQRDTQSAPGTRTVVPTSQRPVWGKGSSRAEEPVYALVPRPRTSRPVTAKPPGTTFRRPVPPRAGTSQCTCCALVDT